MKEETYTIKSMNRDLSNTLKSLKMGYEGRFNPARIIKIAKATQLKPASKYNGVPWNQGWGYLVLYEDILTGRLHLIYGSWSAPVNEENKFPRHWGWYPYAGYAKEKRKTAMAAFRRIVKSVVEDFNYKPKITDYSKEL